MLFGQDCAADLRKCLILVGEHYEMLTSWISDVSLVKTRSKIIKTIFLRKHHLNVQ
jgi:hypothetical protein